MRFLILNGFDRSGTSMIGGLLAKHPEVAYFFQPFSRTEVHESQYEIWQPGQRFPRTEDFLRALLEGRVERDFLGAEHFDRHSTASEPRADGLNVVKETKLHFKLSWLAERFPTLEVRGIWREPRGILCSLLRNGFARDWYGERAFEATSATIRRTPALAGYARLLERELDEYEKLAVVVAARTHVLAMGLSADRWLVYEEILENCDAILNDLTGHFGLPPFAFSEHLGQDFNVSGKPFERADLWRSFFSRTESRRLDTIFAELEPLRPLATLGR